MQPTPHYQILYYIAALTPFLFVLILVRVVRSRLYRLAERNIISEHLVTRAISLVTLLGVLVAFLVTLYILTGVHEALYAAMLVAFAGLLPAAPILANLYAYYVILTERVVAPGEQIMLGDTRGTVYSISLFTTTIRTSTGEMIVLPNYKLINEAVRKEPMDRSIIELEVVLHGVRGQDSSETRARLEDIASRLRKVVLEFRGSIRGLEANIMLKAIEGDDAIYLVRFYMLTAGVRMLTGLVARLMSALQEYRPDVRIRRLD